MSIQIELLKNDMQYEKKTKNKNSTCMFFKKKKQKKQKQKQKTKKGDSYKSRKKIIVNENNTITDRHTKINMVLIMTKVIPKNDDNDVNWNDSNETTTIYIKE